MGSADPATARRMSGRGRGTALLLLAATTACRGRVPLVALEAGPPPSLRLVAAPGARINARLKPALELDGGRVLRFDSPYLTPDSAYFPSRRQRLRCRPVDHIAASSGRASVR